MNSSEVDEVETQPAPYDPTEGAKVLDATVDPGKASVPAEDFNINVVSTDSTYPNKLPPVPVKVGGPKNEAIPDEPVKPKFTTVRKGERDMFDVAARLGTGVSGYDLGLLNGRSNSVYGVDVGAKVRIS